MDWSKGEYQPWEAGWQLGKYQQYTRWPTEQEFDQWIDGFCTGCAEIAEHHIWDLRLREYTEGKFIPAHLITFIDETKQWTKKPDESGWY